MDEKNSQKRAKRLALFGGLIASLILCGIPLAYIVFTGRFQQYTQPFSNAAQTAVVAPIISDTPTQNVEPLATSTNELASLPYSQRFDMAGSDISDALENSWQGNSAEAILSWGKVIEIIPEWPEGYYNRGREYLNLLTNQRSQEEFLYYLSLAGNDFDKAIELDPYSKGSYYYARFRYYDALASNQTTRADTDYLENIALDNLLMANRLGSYEEGSDVKVALVYASVGRCDDVLDQANRLISESDEPTIDMIGSLSRGYFCKGDLENALKYMDQVVSLVDGCQSRFDRARIFYVMGRLDDALADLDATISQSPYYCGIRYYMRGLIYAEKGELDKAQEDLSFGMGQTWERGGLLSYAQGKIALARSDKESAVQYFQDAELTYTIHDPIYQMMLDDLSRLGASPLESTVSFAPVTPIPTPTLQPTLRPTSSPIASIPTPFFTPDPMLQHALIVDLEEAIGPIKIGWNSSSLWRFQPAQSLDHREVKSLSVWLISSDTSQRLPRQLLVWNFRTNMWGSIDELQWGENRAGYQNDLVSQDGDVIIYLVNQDNTLEATVDTLGITLVLQRTDGSVEVHGITP